MSEYLAAAAEKMGVPEPLVERAGKARAAATGLSADDIFGAWAGGTAAPKVATDPAPADTPEETVEAPEPPVEAAHQPAASPQPTATTAPPVPPRIGVEPAAPRAPERVDPAEALDFPAVVTVQTAELAESTDPTIPRWLATIFLILPLFGLLYLAGSLGSADACTEGGIRLAVDRQTGVPVNCDGSEFTGRGAAGGTSPSQLLAIGETNYAGCAGCHGPNGGGGVGPALNNLLNVFGSCSDNIEWVSLGSAGYQAAGRDTYGDTSKPIAGGMPGFGESLSEEELAATVSFIRVRFGGGDPEAVLTDCGLLEVTDETETEARVGASS